MNWGFKFNAEGNMKSLSIVILLCFIFASSCIAQKLLPETNINNVEGPLGSVLIRMGTTLNKYHNYKIAGTIEYSFFETNGFSVSTITSKDKKTRFSSNGLFSIVSFSLMPLIKGYDKYIWLPLLPELLGNVKINIPVFTEHFWIGGGLNTDYYLFYTNSVIFSEGLVGFKVSTEKVRLYCDYRYPINGSYLENKKPYISLGIGLFPNYFD